MGTLVVDHRAEDVVEFELRGAPSGLGRTVGALTGVALGALAWWVLTGALQRPLLPVLLVAAVTVAVFVVLGWPGLASWVTRSRVRIDRRRWDVERWVLGVRWRHVSGPVDALRGVDPDVRQAGGRRGLALVTRERGVLVAAHLDPATRARVAELVHAFLAGAPPPL